MVAVEAAAMAAVAAAVLVGDLEEAVGDLEADLEEEVVVEAGTSVSLVSCKKYMLSLLR